MAYEGDVITVIVNDKGEVQIIYPSHWGEKCFVVGKQVRDLLKKYGIVIQKEEILPCEGTSPAVSREVATEGV